MTLDKTKGPKFRPQLTAVQITHALNLARLDLANPLSTTQDSSLSILSTLAPFKAKIDNMALTPSYVPTAPKQSTLESLGFGAEHGSDVLSSPSSPSSQSSPTAKPLLTPNSDANSYTKLPTQLIPANYPNKEAYWEACYLLFTAHPELATPEQIILANEHAYLHDLMTPEQERAYETNLSVLASAEVIL